MVLTSRLRAVPYYLKNLYHRCLSHSPIRFINFCWNYNAMSFNVWWLGHLLDGLFLRYGSPTKDVNSLSADHTKWSNTLKQFVGFKSYVQPDPLSEFLIIANLQQSANLNMRKTWVKTFLSLLKKWSFPLKISPVNVTRSAISCGFGHIYWRNPWQKTSIFCTVFVE